MPYTIRCDMIREFIVNRKADRVDSTCDQTKKNINEETKTNKCQSGTSPSVKADQMEPEKLWKKGFVE